MITQLFQHASTIMFRIAPFILMINVVCGCAKDYATLCTEDPEFVRLMEENHMEYISPGVWMCYPPEKCDVEPTDNEAPTAD